MKKFIASENIAIASSRNFKDSIELACRNTENGRQFSTSVWDKKFIGTVVTFNSENNEVYCFDLRAMIDVSNHSEVCKALSEMLDRLSSKEEYKNLQFVTLIEASQFEYHGHIGYMGEKELAIYNLKNENIFMKSYIDIITNSCKDFSYDSSEIIENLDLSLRTFNCLKRAGINTLNQIKVLSFDDICKVRNLGRNSLNELEEKLNIKFS